MISHMIALHVPFHNQSSLELMIHKIENGERNSEKKKFFFSTKMEICENWCLFVELSNTSEVYSDSWMNADFKNNMQKIFRPCPEKLWHVENSIYISDHVILYGKKFWKNFFHYIITRDRATSTCKNKIDRTISWCRNSCPNGKILKNPDFRNFR